MENVKNLRVCDKHYASLTYRGHKPAEGKSSSKSRSDAQRGILKVNPCIVQCSQCRNEVCLSINIPYNKHNNLFAVACNFLDGQTGNKTDCQNDLYKVKSRDFYKRVTATSGRTKTHSRELRLGTPSPPAKASDVGSCRGVLFFYTLFHISTSTLNFAKHV